MNGWLQDLEDKKSEGINEGLNTGKNEGLLEAVKLYMKKTKSSKEQAMDFFEVTGDKKDTLLKLL